MEKLTIEKHDAMKVNGFTVGTYDGREVQIKERIPFEEKEQFALDLAQVTLVENEESGVIFRSHRDEMMRAFLFAKYYTNIDVENMDDEEGHRALYDWQIDRAVMKKAVEQSDALWNDLGIVDRMCEKICTASEKVFTEKNSLSHRIKTSLGAILTDESLTESLAKSQVVNEQMIDMLGALMKNGNAQGKIPPVRVGNNVVKLAKK